jgi:hypothetical protein
VTIPPRRSWIALPLTLLALIAACGTPAVTAAPTALEGQNIFRFDTFGDEVFWTDSLRMHEVVEGAGLGGVGAGVSPATALAAGLKVDLDALPPALVADLKNGRVDLTSPATNLATYTGEGTISYWNAYVAVTQMHGQGTFVSPKTRDDIHPAADRVTSKLPALLLYQLSLTVPTPPAGSFDTAAAQRGAAVFAGPARCASCHVAPHYSDANSLLHAPADAGTDPQLARRGTTGQYRTTPLRGLWQHPPYFHDGRAATLEAVVDHYVHVLELNLKPQQRADLVQFLRSL